MDAELANDIGQLLIVGFHGYEPDEGIIELIHKYRVGTIILFNRNIKDAQQLLDLTRSLQQVAKDAEYDQPLLISIDQENGVVTRIPGDIVPRFPGAMVLGASGESAYARDAYGTAAKYLRFYGIHANYAPVADVNSNPNNPVIGIRSFGDDPTKVARFALQGALGSMENRVLPCIKHFPGHGDTSIDSHYGTAVVDKSLEEMKKCELIPFVQGAKENVESIMMAHIVVPCMGDDKPASISPANYKYLKDTLGYKGYIVTDCLEMESISKTVGTEKGAQLAMEAGADGIMISHDLSRQIGGFNNIYRAALEKPALRQSIKSSADKLRQLKRKLVGWDEVLNKKSAASLSAIDVQSDLTRMDQIYKRSATVVRGSPAQYVINKNDKVGLAYVEMADAAFLQSGAVQYPVLSTINPGYYEALKSDDFVLEHCTFKPDSSVNSHDGALKSCDKIILLTLSAAKNESQQKLAHHLSSLGIPLVVIATLSPYDFLAEKWLNEFPVYIPLFEPSVSAFKAVVKVLRGEITPQGVSPISS